MAARVPVQVRPGRSPRARDRERVTAAAARPHEYRRAGDRVASHRSRLGENRSQRRAVAFCPAAEHGRGEHDLDDRGSRQSDRDRGERESGPKPQRPSSLPKARIA